MAAVGPRLRRLERKFGLADAGVGRDDGDFELIPVETWIEGWRDLRAIHEEVARSSGGYWQERYEEWVRTHYEEAEVQAAFLTVIDMAMQDEGIDAVEVTDFLVGIDVGGGLAELAFLGLR